MVLSCPSQGNSATNLGFDSMAVETPGNVILMNPSVHDTLRVNVSPPNRIKHIYGRYLDIGCLLETQMRERNDRAIFVVNGELCVRERSSPKLFSIEQWTDAFIILRNIYVGAHPEKIHQLLKYLHSIRLEGRKEMFYLMTHSTHLRLYGVRHMVKDHSDSKRGNPLPPHGLLFPISSKGCFICIIPQTGLHIPRPLFTPIVEHWLE